VSSEPGYSRQSSIRFMFRVAAVGVLLLAGYFLYVGLADFFAADDEPPQKFWMLFVGLPLVAVGLWLAGAGFGGAAARYAAGEGAPVARDSLDYLTRTHRDTEPTGGPYCRACGTRNDAAASFCDSCGKSLA
jgi:hypothetical protein